MTDFLAGALAHYNWAKGAGGYITSVGRVKSATYSNYSTPGYGYPYSPASITEGLSYYLLAAVLHDDYKTFNLIWTWIKTYMQLSNANILASKVGNIATALDAFKDTNGLKAYTDLGRTFLYLFGWLYRDNWDETQNSHPKPGLVFCDNATDGDLLIATALLKAYEKWGVVSYRTEALNIIADYKTFSMKVCNGHNYMVMGSYSGFETATQYCVNSSYQHPNLAYKRFAKHDTANAAFWNDAATQAYSVMTQATANNSFTMPSQQVGVNKTTGALGIFNGTGQDSEYDATRVYINAMLDNSTSANTFLNTPTVGIKKYYTDNAKVPQTFPNGGPVTFYAPAWNNYANLDFSPYGCAELIAQDFTINGLSSAQTLYTAFSTHNWIPQTADGYFAADNIDYYPNWLWYLLFIGLGSQERANLFNHKSWLTFTAGTLAQNQTDFNTLLATINTALGYPNAKAANFSPQYKHTDNIRLAMPIWGTAYQSLSGAQVSALTAELPAGIWTAT